MALYASAGYVLGLAEMARRVLARWGRVAAGYIALAWRFFLALALPLSVSPWDLNWNFRRGASQVGMLSLLLLAPVSLPAPRRLRRVALVATLALWLVTFASVAPAATPTF